MSTPVTPPADGRGTTRDPGASGTTDPTGTSGGGAMSAKAFGRDRASVVAREKEAFGGVKVGSAFFGWLTATGTAVLLTALLAGAGTAVSVATDTTLDDVASQPETVGIAGSIALLVIVLVAYYCGGYVAGRMARFDGVKQGIAVWVWAVVVAVVVAVLGLVAGNQFDVLAQLNAFPRLPVGEGELTTSGVVAVLIVAAASLVGAILGGIAGMRFHRKVDKVGLAS
ncbi:hypothetical protein [Cellulomonas marina]|uniref:Uncharacterized protein n=1 Tax=Cellulomonas marina TaxID=988821 RepID=A0A1I1AHX4_9CELL|nr:hypothetical protein [Cellulomonas marina]GIG29706.1 hypothetical protein Cma02nite_23060 [Cellulomonas marina]SFB36088.1 hypothetical protein SAMN05421867_11747 [Cellulomonas marina]